MRALRFDNTLAVTDAEPSPNPTPHEALIRLRLAGICHTDLELTRGYMGFHGVLGHEFVGEIAAPVAHMPDSERSEGELPTNQYVNWRVGQRVVGEINIACRACDFCTAGIPSQCRNRRCLGIDRYMGAFAEYLKLPLINLYAVPDAVPDEAAVFTEPLAAALQVTEQVGITPSSRVVVIGAGKLGLLIAQVLKLTGCNLTVIARRPRPIELLYRWGIAHVDSAAALDRQQAHVVVDATGNAEGFAAALDLVRPRGTILLKSTYAALPQADLTRVVVNEIRIIGSRCGPFDAALRMLAAHLIDVQSLIERQYPLTEALPAFEDAAQPGVLKVLLSP